MWEEGRQDMWSLALVEEVGKQHSYTMKREGAASAGHMQFAGGKKALLWRLLLAVVMEQYQQYLESLKCVVLMEPFPCTPHSPVKPGTRSLSAQMSGPAELSSECLFLLSLPEDHQSARCSKDTTISTQYSWDTPSMPGLTFLWSLTTSDT